MLFCLWSGFHLWNSLLCQVTGCVSALPPVKPRSRLKKTEDPVLSIRLVFHGHVVASVTPDPSPPDWKIPAKLSWYFLLTNAAPPHMCFCLENFNFTFFQFNMKWPELLKWGNHCKQSGADAIISFMFMQKVVKHAGAVNDPKHSIQVIRQFSVISCNQKTCWGRVLTLAMAVEDHISCIMVAPSCVINFPETFQWENCQSPSFVVTPPPLFRKRLTAFPGSTYWWSASSGQV